MIDPQSSQLSDMRRSYERHASGAVLSVADFVLGERLLVDVGLAIEVDGRLHRSPMLSEAVAGDDEDLRVQLVDSIVAMGQMRPHMIEDEGAGDLVALVRDEQRRRELLLAIGRKFDDEFARLVGEIGEELVAHEARRQLQELGHKKLAKQVRRVSLRSDALGFDVLAPRVVGRPRLLEVKASTSPASGNFFLSRNESEVGRRNREDWFLVACLVTDTASRSGEILGWSTRDALEVHLPVDQGAGEWRSVRIALDPSGLNADLPPAG